MSAKNERMQRKLTHGGVLDSIPSGVGVKPGTITVEDGRRVVELQDGRLAFMPPMVAAWAIRDGKIVKDVPVGISKK